MVLSFPTAAVDIFTDDGSYRRLYEKTNRPPNKLHVRNYFRGIGRPREKNRTFCGA